MRESLNEIENSALQMMPANSSLEEGNKQFKIKMTDSRIV